MHQFDSELTGQVFDYMRDRLSMPEVPLDFPGDPKVLADALSGLVRPEGNSAESILKLYDEVISRTVVSGDSPRFMAFIPTAPTKAALLFDMIVSCASIQGISWLEAAGAISAENQVLRWMSDVAGLPESAGGTFVSGGSAANLAALTVARDSGRKRLHGGKRLPVRIALSEQAHSSIGNSLDILDIEPLRVETAGYAMTKADLERALLAVKDNDAPVVGVVATAGTTNAGIIDDLAGISEVARNHDMWFHVDAAYGGAGLLAPSVREQFAGIENADSITMDPHKWWFSPFDVAAILYKNPKLAASVHTQDASYLDVLHEDDSQINPTDLAYHLTRRARGLPLWFSVVVNGTDAYRDAVEASISLTNEVADFIRGHENLELVIEPSLSVVLWRRKGWNARDYRDLQDKLIESQTAFVTPTSWQGETVGRFAFVHPGTTIDMVKEVFANI
ncbi:MAG: aspartate aminotransferase family protein [Actinobacteria bacterium]|nr:aspartate aminotransferase family protein [Actinomycetota bacterium]